MIGLVMAGGRGSRMEFPSPEKLLLEYEKPIIFHVIDSLNDSHCFSKVFAATSLNSPDTKRVLEEKGIETLDERLKPFTDNGAKFTKWRAVINIGKNIT